MTLLRRQSEFLQILKEMGGIANSMTPEFPEKHVALLSSLTSNASAPAGTEIDKRTMKQTVTWMADKQLLKMITVVIQGVYGHDKSCYVFHLLDLEQTVVDEYVASLNKLVGYHPPSQLPKLAEPVKFANSVDRNGNMIEELRSSSPVEPQVLTENDLIRQRIMEDKPVIAQSAGYITGRLARVKELHLFLRSRMEDTSSSSHFITPKIFGTAYLWDDLPFAMHCAMVSTPDRSQRLIDYLSFDTNRWKPCRLIPNEISDIVLIGRMRSRRSLLDLLHLLQRLQILVPLAETQSDSPFVSVEDETGTHAFDVAADSETIMPSHWMFTDHAPLFKVFGRSDPLPYAGQYDVSTEPGRLRFWDDFERSALGPADNLPNIRHNVPAFLAPDLLRIAHKVSSWVRDYRLSHTQRQFLSALVNPATGTYSLKENPDEIDEAVYITGAPRDAILGFLDRKSREIQGVVFRLQRRQQTESKEKTKERDARVALAARAAEQRKRVEHDWQDYLSSILPDPRPEGTDTRLAAIHEDFIKTNGRINRKFRYETTKNDILFTLGLGSRRRPGALPAEFRNRLQRPLAPNYFPTPTVQSSTTETTKSVYDLIHQQEPLEREPAPASAPPEKKKRKRKSKAKEAEAVAGTPSLQPPCEDTFKLTYPDADEEEPVETTATGGIVSIRRRRFKWNREYDEMAFDAMAIIRSRCRQNYRTVWEPALQVFPAMDRNSYRNRVIKLLVGNEGYAQRLENAWHELWLRHRGTNRLSDDDPTELNKFDLAEHIMFLRKNVDKDSLCVPSQFGFSPGSLI